MISPTALATRLADHLPRQRWFGAKDRAIDLVRVTGGEMLVEGWPALYRVEVEVTTLGTPQTPGTLGTPQTPGTGDDTAHYQLMLGLRPTGEPCEFLTGHQPAVLGEFETDQGHALVYDALLDPDLSLTLLARVVPHHQAEHVRPVGAEQSNTSLVYDDAVILKVFRRLAEGRNPEVEVTEALAEVGFAHVAEPLGAWLADGRDLAFAQRFLAGATEGWAMALTSLRDLYADPMDPAEAGGDFGAEAFRLGEVTADLHQAMAQAFGRTPGNADEWADLMEEQIKRVLAGDIAEGARRLVAGLRDLDDAGPALRGHGDYHLGQVLRTDTGWYVLDFEGEPARPLAQRTRPTSPLKDVAAMLRSLAYAPMVAMATQDENVTALARAWEARNRACFLEGYFARAEDADLLPPDPAARSAVLTAFELDKAVYEVAYEQAHRPDWVDIPTQAVAQLVRGA
ncbi:MAG: maltokinase N-terminal cap-like domain-containing protein [Acidimicrobiia bacterium]